MLDIKQNWEALDSMATRKVRGRKHNGIHLAFSYPSLKDSPGGLPPSLVCFEAAQTFRA